MAGFLYFVPNVETVGPDLVKKLELDHAIGRKHEAAPVTRGPSGEPGVILAAEGSVPACGYYPESQKWVMAPHRKWCIGSIAGHEPTPDDLERNDSGSIEAQEVELVDGRRWKLPVARRFEDPEAWQSGRPFQFFVNLPRSLAYQSDGTWASTEVIPQYRSLWNLALDWAAVRHGEPDEELLKRFDVDHQAQSAIRCLAIKYRIGPVEATHLGLLTLEACREILDVLIDFRRYVQLLKKKRDALSAEPGSHGAEDS